MIFAGKESILSLDVALIAVFTLIFIDFKELAFLLSETSFPLNTTIRTFLLSAGLSQLISNVPTTVLFASKVKWLPLALGVNLGGNGITPCSWCESWGQWYHKWFTGKLHSSQNFRNQSERISQILNTLLLNCDYCYSNCTGYLTLYPAPRVRFIRHLHNCSNVEVIK